MREVRRANRHDIEIESLQPLAVEREVDRARLHRDADLGEVALPDHVAELRAALGLEILELERLALGVAQHAVLVDIPARLLEQRLRFLQVLAQRVGAGVGARRLVRHAEHFLRKLRSRNGSSSASSPGLGSPLGGEVGVGEEAVRAPAQVVEIDLLEVVGVVERLAHAAILEQRAAHVEQVRLVPLAHPVLEDLLLRCGRRATWRPGGRGHTATRRIPG